MKDTFVTLDIDWAPDTAIHAAADVLERAGCRATWFVTHRSPALERLRSRPDLFELGIHPNFLPGSSHGSDPEGVLDHVLGIAPEARSVRAHSAAQSGPILKAIRRFPQIRLDCSVMFPGLAGVAPVPYGDGVQMLWRVPNFWSDDYEAEMRAPSWALDERFAVPGVKVLVFHPIHVALNTGGIDGYAELKARAPDVREWSDDVLEDARREGPGARALFASVATRLGAAGGGRHLSALVPEPAA
jgi:hypothetical protein